MAIRVQAHHPGPSAGDSSEYRVEIEDDESPWLVQLYFVERPGRAGGSSGEWLCVGYELRRRGLLDQDSPPAGEVEVTADVHQTIVANWDNYLAFARPALEFDMQDAVKRTTALRARGQGRRGLSAEFYEQIAGEYRRLVERGANPTTELAQAHHVARSTASNWIARARELGYLGPATPGRAGEGTGKAS